MAHLKHPLRSKSSSSAIDFESAGTTTGLSISPSSSTHSKHHGPSLSTQSSPDAYGMENPRKRNTWGRVVDAGQDPLRLDSGSSSLSPSTSASRGNRHGASASPPPPLPLGMTSSSSTAGGGGLGVYAIDDDPFLVPITSAQERVYNISQQQGSSPNTSSFPRPTYAGHPDSYSSFDPLSSREPDEPGFISHNPYASQASAGPSSASFMTRNDTETLADDDEAHLTANMSRGTSGDHHNSWRDDSDYGDPERTAGSSSNPSSARRRTVRYSAQSPLKEAGNALASAGRNLRRVSLRVVNLASAGLENQIRLPDDDVSGSPKRPPNGVEEEDLKKKLPIRGRTLCCLGPDSELRLFLYNFLVHK
jgi:voltage-dependent calcium channel